MWLKRRKLRKSGVRERIEMCFRIVGSVSAEEMGGGSHWNLEGEASSPPVN